MPDVELTELEKLEVTRVDAVSRPANGFPVLLMKGVAAPVVKGARDCPKCDKSYDADHKGDNCENCGTKLPAPPASKAAGDKVDCPTCKGDGKIMGDKRDCPDCGATGKVTPAKAKQLAAKSVVKMLIAVPTIDPDVLLKAVGADGQVDEAPDIAGGTQIIGLIADMIINEAQELKAGAAGEISDIFQLACAAESIWAWRTGEQAVSVGSIMPADVLMQSAADVAKEKHNTADRKKLAEQGNALSDGSYPIADEDDLKSAAILAQSGHGDVDGAKRLIARRAKELGVKNPLDDGKKDDDASKSAIAKEGTPVDTVTQGNGDLSKAVADAVTKATAPLREQLEGLVKSNEALSGELAKVKAMPVPGPVLSGNVQVKRPGGIQDSETAAKAALMRQKASDATAPADREGYLALARELEQKARTPASA